MRVTLTEKMRFINSKMKIVMFDEDLELITNPEEKKLKELKRLVQDCISTVECEGAEFIGELDKYATDLYNQLKK